METFSKLRPPEAVAIKAKLVETTNPTASGHPLDQLLNGGDTVTKDRRISSASQISTVSSSSCSSYAPSCRVTEAKKFCVDPQVTSFDVLSGLIAHAFSIKSEFRLSYLNRSNTDSASSRPPSHPHDYISLQTDWDLDAAFSSSSRPYLNLIIELIPAAAQPKSEFISDEWEVINPCQASPTSCSPPSSTSSSPTCDTSLSSETSRTGSGPNKSALSESKSKSTVIHKCVSVIHKVFNNFTRSNSFTSATITPRAKWSHESQESRTPSLSPVPPSSPQSWSTPTPNPPPASPLHGPAHSSDPTAMAIATALLVQQQKPPLGDAEFRNFCDSDGRVVNLVDLKQRIFEGGCEPAKRRELWPILLDIYPDSCATHRQRDEFLRVKQSEYASIKNSLWYRDHRDLMTKSAHCISDSSFDSNNNNHHNMANLIGRGTTSGDLTALYSLAHKIHKDVCRTDRNQKFYSGESNTNVIALFNILITFALSHPNTPYAQGMSDLLSPLLYVLKDESLAYTCFLALISRCAPNFSVHSDSIALKIKLLGSLIARYDPELWSHLVQVGAEQMLFVYRWLLLECKREFPFEDSLRVLECMWSTIDYSTNRSDNMEAMKSVLNGKTGTAYVTRSNSTASSSISLRLLRELCNAGSSVGLRAISNDDCFGCEDHDEDFVGSEAMDESISIAGNKSRHQSQNSQASTAPTTEISDLFAKDKPDRLIKRTSSTIDSDVSSRSRSNSSISSLSSTNSMISGSDLDMSSDEDDFDARQLTPEKAANKPMGRLRRFSLNLSFLKSSKQTKECHKPVNSNTPTSLSLTHEYGSEIMKRFEPNKKLFDMIRNKKLAGCRRGSSANREAKQAPKRRSKSLGDLLPAIEVESKPGLIKPTTNRIDIPRPKFQTPRGLESSKKFSLPMYMSANNGKTMVNTPLAMIAGQIAMSSSAKFSTSEAETIVVANNPSANLRNSLYQQLSYSPTIVNTCGSQKPSRYLHRSTPISKKTNQIHSKPVNSVESATRVHKKSRLRTRTRSKLMTECLPKSTTSTGEDEKYEPRKLKKHHPKTTSFKKIKNSLKRSKKYLDNFYSANSKMARVETKPVAVKPVCVCDESVKRVRDADKARVRLGSEENQPTGSSNVKSETTKNGNNTHSSSKSSTSAYVSATHSLASSHSSLCSNFNQMSNHAAGSRRSSFVSKQVPVINITSPLTGTTSAVTTTPEHRCDPHPDTGEEELIYSLSKLDNPFLLFMCLSMFIEHRKHIMHSQMDANDIACYFDKMTRKHSMRPVIARARYLYTKLYLAKANVFSYIQQLMDIQNSP